MSNRGFTVITPKPITESNLISSNVTENDYPVWSGGTNYSLGARVIMTTGIHKVYESITGGNNNNQPNLHPEHWVEVGPTNRYKMFDSSTGTMTTNPSNITFSFTADRINAIGLLDINATSISITASAPGEGTFYSQVFLVPDRAIIGDWYDYFYADNFRATSLTITDIPALMNTMFDVVIESTSGNAECGSFIIGNTTELGLTQYGAGAGIIDYSVKSTDQFGKTTITERPFSKRLSAKLYVESAEVDAVINKLNSLRATPCLWLGADGVYESLSVYGFYRDYTPEITYPTYSIVSIEIEGLT
jgi:hypothetical protein